MIRNTISIIFVVLIGIFFSILLFEIFFKIVPLIYKNIPESSNTQYIYILGESSADGFPDRVSFAKVLECVIKKQQINNKQICIISLAKPACTLNYQYIRYLLYRFLHPTHKGIMLLYMGTNNWAKENKYSDFYRKLCLNFGICQMFDIYKVFFKDKNIKLENYDFEYEYERIVLLAKKFGEDIYISTIAGNYKWLFKYDNENDIEIQTIDNLIFSNKIEEAKELCDRKLKTEKKESIKIQLWYRLGKIFELENKNINANKAYFNVAEYRYEGRPSPRFQNEIIREIAKKYNIPVFDFFQYLLDSGKTIGFDFFMDNIHPTKKTHIDIAYGFLDLLNKKYKFEFIDKENLDIKELEEDMGVTNKNKLITYMFSLLCMQLEGINNFKFNFDTYVDWLTKIKQINVVNYDDIKKEDIDDFINFEESVNLLNIDKQETKIKLEQYLEKTFGYMSKFY